MKTRSTCLVTGGAGFIGSFPCARLALAAGCADDAAPFADAEGTER
jgi:nucleoside-diphosphate-sugar epimerase